MSAWGCPSNSCNRLLTTAINWRVEMSDKSNTLLPSSLERMAFSIYSDLFPNLLKFSNSPTILKGRRTLIFVFLDIWFTPLVRGCPHPTNKSED
ncbi:MAG: hypothetical protein [Circular genetic element sp.]|nr:MAG: hypothetical protein [Circular genetic element sp.]